MQPSSSGTSVVDLEHWRAHRGAAVAEEGADEPAEVSRVASAGRGAGDGPVAEVGPSAELLHLPARAAGSPGGAAGQPPVRSVFGPVMAFGLARREAPARAAAVGDDEPAPTPRVRALRQRHLRDARGATRGPGR